MRSHEVPLLEVVHLNAIMKEQLGQSQRENAAATLVELSTSLVALYGSDSPAALELNRIHCSEDFTFLTADQHENALPSAGSFEDQIADTAIIRKANPDWHAGAFNFNAQINTECTLGTVWYTVRGTGITDSSRKVIRESVIKLYWRKRSNDQKWELYKNEAIYGPGNFFAMDDAKEWVDIGV